MRDFQSVRRRSVPFLLFLALLLVLSACGGKSQGTAGASDVSSETPAKSAETPKTITIRDAYDREVTIPLPVKRVAALAPGALRFVIYLDGVDRLAGVEAIEQREASLSLGRTYTQIYEKEFKALPTISPGGPQKAPDPEALAKVNPDVVFTTLDPKELDALTQKVNFPVVSINFTPKLSQGFPGPASTEFGPEFRASLELVAKVLGREDRAQKLLQDIEVAKKDLQERAARAANKPGPRVYLGGLAFRGGAGIESTAATYFPFDILGANNVAQESGKQGSFLIDKEKLLEWNPDVIFIDSINLDLIRQDCEKRPKFYHQLKALQDGRTYTLLPIRNYGINGEIALLDAYWVGKILYPEAFGDVDLDRKGRELFRMFFGDKGEGAYEELIRTYGGLRTVNPCQP